MDHILIAESSDVLVGRGLPPRILPGRAGREQVALVVQPGARPVAAGLADRLAAEVGNVVRIDVPDRDAAKDLGVVGAVYHRLADMNLGRHDAIVAVGGGATTDVAGFVAATWLRGVEAVLVPTTLLGAVDAAIGGKTGINLDGKNLVGAFWLPSRVVVDLDVLDALPDALRREGAAEAAKAGFIGDPAIVAAYAEDGLGADLEVIVPRAITVKAGVVSGDVRELGRRTVLNFGHTVGHAVERLAGLSHGEAVAIGMVAASRVSFLRYGFDEQRVVEIVARLGLPTRVEGVDPAEALDLMARDKKRTAAGIRLVLLEEVGRPVVVPVEESELRAALAAVGVG